jgi:anti-anti-sigma factor
MSELTITIEDLTPYVPGKVIKIAKFTGQMDSSNVEEKKVIFDELIKQNPTNLCFLFDFENLTYLNSRAIGCLAECLEDVQKGGGKIVIARPPENVHDVLRVVGIEKVIPVYPTLDSAKLAISK